MARKPLIFLDSPNECATKHMSSSAVDDCRARATTSRSLEGCLKRAAASCGREASSRRYDILCKAKSRYFSPTASPTRAAIACHRITPRFFLCLPAGSLGPRWPAQHIYLPTRDHSLVVPPPVGVIEARRRAFRYFDAECRDMSADAAHAARSRAHARVALRACSGIQKS